MTIPTLTLSEQLLALADRIEAGARGCPGCDGIPGRLCAKCQAEVGADLDRLARAPTKECPPCPRPTSAA
jgi:hypothetical protein